MAPNAQWILHLEEAEIEKDHRKVTSLVATKEHVTFSHVRLESTKSCEKKVWRNARIPSLGYGASYASSSFLQKPRSLAKVSEHFFSQLSFDSSRTWLKVTCSFVATNDVTFPWSFSSSASFWWKIHWTCGATWGRKVVSLSKANLQIQYIGRLPAFSGLFINCSKANLQNQFTGRLPAF